MTMKHSDSSSQEEFSCSYFLVAVGQNVFLLRTSLLDDDRMEVVKQMGEV